MDTCYNAKTVSLHVRKSNRGAIRLYEELLGYKVAGVASSYYSDGEDAFLMQAHLPVNDAVHATQVNSRSVTQILSRVRSLMESLVHG